MQFIMLFPDLLRALLNRYSEHAVHIVLSLLTWNVKGMSGHSAAIEQLEKLSIYVAEEILPEKVVGD